MRRFFVLALLSLYFCFLVVGPVFAQDFTTGLNAEFDIREDGTASVTETFTIHNQTSTEYVTQYAFEISGNRNKNIVISSNGKTIEPKISAGRNKITVQIAFPDKIVGKEKVREFQVKYDSLDSVTKIGKTLEVAIPRLANPAVFSTYSITLKVPTTLGPAIHVTPTQFTTRVEDGKTILRFDHFGAQTGVSASFGREQLAKLTLQYHLQNTNTTKSLVRVAFPPDNTYQRVYYDKIDPTPASMMVDADQNWIASYELEPNQKLDVTTSAHVETQSTPQENAVMLTEKPGYSYTKRLEFWPTDDAQISKIARDLTSAESIYDYVVKTLRYDYAKADQESKRLGAIEALNNPGSSVCTEFTDLFITLARRKNIPARAVVGYAYSANADLRPTGIARDLLHAWPEYWDEKTGAWVAVDPTWEQTTGGIDYFHHLDLNRIVFATQGISSTIPIPAGMYKLAGQESKDIQVEFTDALPEYEDSYTTELRIHPRTLLGLGDTYGIVVKNTSLHAVYAVPIHIKTTNSDGILEQYEKMSLIPYEEKEIPVQLPSKGFLSHGESIITVRVGTQEFSHELTLTTTIKQFLPLIVITILVASSIGICVYIARRLLVPRWQR